MRRLVALSLLVLLAAQPARGDDAPGRIHLSALGSMERIGQGQEPHGPPEVKIEAARGEVESFQVVVSARDGSLVVTQADVSDFVGDAGARIGKNNIALFREEYVWVRRSTPHASLPPGLYADPLVPFVNPASGRPLGPPSRSRGRQGESSRATGFDIYALPFEVFDGQNQPIWVDIRVPEDARPGIYRGTVTVSARGGREAVLPMTLEVWDFTLPPGPTHPNHFGNFQGVTYYFDCERDSDRYREIEMHYCRALAEHRLNPPLPSSLLPEVQSDGSLKILPDRHKALVQFMNDLHVTSFEIPRAPFARLPRSTDRPGYNEVSPAEREKAHRYYRQYYDYLKANGWEQRAYLYMLDEPNSREAYEQVLALGKMVHEAVPELKRLVVEQTYTQNPTWPDIDPAIDIWCPLWAFIDEPSIRRKIADGDEVWSYTALAQRTPPYHPEYEELRDKDPAYWHIDQPLAVYRMPTWVNWRYGITGLLYWTTITRMHDPWANPAFAHSQTFNGGGFLLYPGTACGVDGPIACIRLKNLRDGMEDYEYFAILQKRQGQAAVDKIVRQTAPNWWAFSRNPATIQAARRELAKAIVAD